jgi:eukaryotic-like serine/threonine-protein kinase
LARTPLRPDDPTRIGHYRLTARLGAGGMGVVYLGVAWDGSPVAVKVLRPELADDEEFRVRFGREVAALVLVKGECTVRVIEADSQSAMPFVVTEYAPGPSLSEYMEKHGSVGPEMLFGLATGLAEALTVIHAAGIMHRDLKPSNIILTDAGPKVIDFGIARRQDTVAVTKAGMMIGSMGFMAPEQISGNPGPEADVFAWGVTVAYAASGRSPFGAGSTHSILYKIMYGDADISTVPDSLRPLVEDALIKDPQNRPTARQLLDRLTSASRRNEETNENPTQLILRRTWQSGAHTSPSPASAPSPNRPAEPLPRMPAEPAASRPDAPSARIPADPPTSIPAEARWILARQPAPPSQAVPSPAASPGPASAAAPAPAGPRATDPPTADGPVPGISAVAPQPSSSRPSAPRPSASQPPASEPPASGTAAGEASAKTPVGRRMATMATSALAAMRLRRPSRREPGQ